MYVQRCSRSKPSFLGWPLWQQKCTLSHQTTLGRNTLAPTSHASDLLPVLPVFMAFTWPTANLPICASVIFFFFSCFTFYREAFKQKLGHLQERTFLGLAEAWDWKCCLLLALLRRRRAMDAWLCSEVGLTSVLKFEKTGRGWCQACDWSAVQMTDVTVAEWALAELSMGPAWVIV